jgi:alkylation response protein AidB-like acyl-CoA dehydrogenase
MSYVAPVNDMLFCMKELADLEAIARLPGFDEAGLDTAQAVLEECARFSGEVLAPLNREGDIHPSTWKDGVVTTTPGFKEAFRQFGEGGWQGHAASGRLRRAGPAEDDRRGVHRDDQQRQPELLALPLLTDGAIEALLTAGTREQQEQFIPKMISGEWTGTMNLTEPQAGSDLALVRTRAEPLGDGRYKLFGTKIFITFGEHDMAENIVHLVLARVVGAPEGVKGISLFIVPKFLVNRRRLARRAQRRLVRQHRAQARHQGEPDGGAPVRRPGRPGPRRSGRDRHLDRRRRTAASRTCSS